MMFIIKRIFTLLPVLALALFLRNLLVAESFSEVIDEYLHIVGDPAHVMAEFTFITIEALIIAPIVAFLVARHDRKHHKHEDHTDCD